MKLLIIDTTKPTAFVIAVCEDLNYVKTIPETKKHSEELLNQIEITLNGAGVGLNDFDALACVTGPGSFTGIRIGMSTIKAFLCAGNFKLLSANVFEIVGEHIKNGSIVLKNTASGCYVANIKNGKISREDVVENVNLKNMVQGLTYAIREEHLAEQLSYINLTTIDNYAEILINHFKQKYAKQKFDTINNFSPYYMQLSQAERELEDKNDKKTK